MAPAENMSLGEEIEQLKQQIEELTIKQRCEVQRSAGSDRDIRFFTRFASYEHLMHFWTLIEPALSSMVTVTQVQRGNVIEPNYTTTHSLQPIDELFMFLNNLALDSKQHDLADWYWVHQSRERRCTQVGPKARARKTAPANTTPLEKDG
ncbi:uncharacterized protein KZ484_008262 [Pholidichthys leucotaenia]